MMKPEKSEQKSEELGDQDGELVYNVPDGLEEDPDIIRSELLFFNTPRNQMYSDYVYFTLKNIQQQCSADYENMCDKSVVINADINQILSAFFSINPPSRYSFQRRLMPSTSTSGAAVIQKLRSLLYVKPEAVHTIAKTSVRKEDVPIIPPHVVIPKKARRRALIDPYQPQPEPPQPIPVDGGSRPPVSGLPIWLPLPFPPPPQPPRTAVAADGVMPHGAWRDHDGGDKDKKDGGKKGDHHGNGWGWGGDHHDGDSDSDGEDGDSDKDREQEEDPWQQPPQGPDRRHRHQLPPDTFFAGALGFGAEGDMCMYQSLDSLSDPCVSAVADLYSLRSQYWAADQTPPPSPCGAHAGVLFFLLGLLGVVLFVKKMRFQKKKKAVNSFLSAINANPQLKAAVEQHTQQKVPELLGCCNHTSKCGGWVLRLLRGLLVLASVLVASFVIAVSSLEITAHIIGHIDHHAAEGAAEGEEPSHGPVSAMAALLILTAVCAIHVSLFFLAVRVVRCLYMRWMALSPSPSAPSDPNPTPGEFSFLASPPSEGQPQRFFVVRNKLQQLKNIAFNSFRRPQQASNTSRASNTNGMYAPLLAEEEESEMVAVVTANGQLHPVSASPLTQVNMV
mmetsp:Transcript_5249/g.7442  ORF Transcript_5249/g.7442 Transcript_5249/m.7442 type:complete len:618 (+) Transcript_5249:21-1874(+)